MFGRLAAARTIQKPIADIFRFENAPREERDKTEPFRVPRFHRTLSGWVSLIVEAGLVIERFGEPRVSVEAAKA
jgi:hypothetical protein